MLRVLWSIVPLIGFEPIRPGAIHFKWIVSAFSPEGHEIASRSRCNVRYVRRGFLGVSSTLLFYRVSHTLAIYVAAVGVEPTCLSAVLFENTVYAIPPSGQINCLKVQFLKPCAPQGDRTPTSFRTLEPKSSASA